MNIKKRIPMDVLQAAVYALLKAEQSTPVHDFVPATATAPYITFGAFTWKNVGAKSVGIGDVSLQIHIYSTYKGKKEINEISNTICTILSSVVLDLSASGFRVMSQDADFIEAFPDDEDDGYHAVITFIAKIQDLGGR